MKRENTGWTLYATFVSMMLSSLFLVFIVGWFAFAILIGAFAGLGSTIYIFGDEVFGKSDSRRPYE